MAALQLGTVRVTAKHRVYLDTSALTSLVLVEAAKHGQPPPDQIERRRASDLTAFFAKVKAVGGNVFTTSLVLEEEFARARNVSRDAGARAATGGTMGYRALKKADPTRAAVVDRQAWTNMLHTIVWSTTVLSAGAVTVDFPPVGSGVTQKFAAVLRADHESLMQRYNELDAMDALHIAVGGHMGVTTFISFDKGWRTVNGIDVYYS